MKKILPILLICALLAGCGAPAQPEVTEVTQGPGVPGSQPDAPAGNESTYTSRFGKETQIHLSDSGIDVSGPDSLSVFASNDIIYYEDREEYEGGNPYGEGEAHERHTQAEAEAHTVVNITAPGAYRVSGRLSAGQLRIDLGDDAYEDPNAVVELILDGADITCTVAPAILFLNVYECDGNWDKDTAKPDVDTAAAGANLILEGENSVSGSYVAKIFKDKDGEKKLWKQDGAVYSYMSMNVHGPGTLNLNAENEGMDTELHLTIHSGNLIIRSGNDGINTNEDDVSVTTINGGNLHILAGLGEEGDGIDSNGYLVINGGTVISAANPASDAGLDSSLGSFIHGGTVVALGASMDWAESDSGQVTMNLQFASYQEGAIRITREDGMEVFSYDPGADAVVGENARRYQGAVLSCGDFSQGESYLVYVNDTQMAYTGTDVKGMGRPGMGGFGGGQRPEGGRGSWAEDGERPTMPEGQEPPEKPEGEMHEGPGGFPNREQQSGEKQTLFYMQDKVNFFSGLTDAK